MLKLSTKCCISAFNAQGSRGIVVEEVETLRKKERQGETQEPSKSMVF
jgi:hypothetical protein